MSSTVQDKQNKSLVDLDTQRSARRIIGDLDFPIPINVVADQVLRSKVPTIYNINVLLADTEVSQLLSDGTKQLAIRCRGSARTQFAFVSGDSSISFITVPQGTTYFNDNLDLTSKTIYLQCNKASQIVEVLEWT